MSTARESLLKAAHEAVAVQPWSGVRMVDVAVAAGVSRQTLYNEFGSKEGLGTALVDRQVEAFLDGAARAAADAGRNGADTAACCAASAAWMLRAARAEPVVHAALTGCWGTRMPPPARKAPVRPGAVPGEPAELAAVLRDRTLDGLRTQAQPGPPGVALATRRGVGRACEVGLRMALSYVVAPVHTSDDETCRAIGDVVRTLLPRL